MAEEEAGAAPEESGEAAPEGSGENEQFTADDWAAAMAEQATVEAETAPAAAVVIRENFVQPAAATA